MTAHQHLYGTQHWRRRARLQLMHEPVCAMCAARGRVVPATVADHVERHHGDVNKFYCGKLQSLCKRCHDRQKTPSEIRGYDTTVDPDTGEPVDPRHPWNRPTAARGKA